MPTDEVRADLPDESESPPPLGLRIAAVLCAIVGAVSLAGALVVSLPLVHRAPGTWIPLVVNLGAALLVCAAAVLVWRRRRLGVLCVVLAWALPTAVSLMAGAAVHGPSYLMVLALVALTGNWHELR